MNRQNWIGAWMLIVVIILLHPDLYAQNFNSRDLRKITASPKEIISLSASLPFNEAISIINDFSEKYLNKVIVNPKDLTVPIGINIDRLYWLEALDQVLSAQDLRYQEYPDYIMIVDSESKQEEGQKQHLAWQSCLELYETREVVISAIFFEANINKLKQMGTSWNFMGNGEDFSVDMMAGDGKVSLLQFTGFKELDFGSLMAVFKAMSTNQIGEILASPQITVQSNTSGRIQIGSDFSYSTKDFSGNTITQFFSTGTIINVTPQIIANDTLQFININLDIQKSNAISSDLGIEVKKTSAQTQVMLIDGEETMIGGLYSKETSNSRDGVPFLKDLPWWVLGLKYIFGYQKTSEINKELVIILRADLVPSIKERLAEKINRINKPEVLKNNLEEFQKSMEEYDNQLRDNGL